MLLRPVASRLRRSASERSVFPGGPEHQARLELRFAMLRAWSISCVLVLSACSEDPAALDGGADGSLPDACTDPACVDPCAADPCMEAHSVCVAEGRMARCECEPGFHQVGALCEPDEGCTDSTCGGHGTCTLDDDGPSCACDAGYVGTNCEACDAGFLPDGNGGCSETPCSPNPCSERGRERCEATATGPECRCSAGWHDEGGDCVEDTTCSATTCGGHGACSMTGTDLSCACDDGWAGARCDACDETGGYHADGAGGCTMDPCLPSPCGEPMRGVCVAEPTGARCDCDPGTHDAGGACVIDDVCTPDSCSMRGECVIEGGVRACACDEGFAGDACERCDSGYHDDGAGGCTTDPCLPSPCTMPNRGMCSPGGAGTICECDAGYHEDGVGGCTTDPCRPDPCAASNQACRAVGGVAECYTPPCDDMNPCTIDAVAGGRCMHTMRADGSSCSTSICRRSEMCTAGVCGGGSAVVCDDSNPCTSDRCVEPTGCAYVNDDTLVPADSYACTVDRCSAGRASHTPSNALCDDALFCNGAETCVPGPTADPRGCLRSAAPVAPGPSTPCRSYGACDEASDSFPLSTLPAGASCDDHIACTR
jgi:hypothetical protein